MNTDSMSGLVDINRSKRTVHNRVVATNRRREQQDIHQVLFAFCQLRIKILPNIRNIVRELILELDNKYIDEETGDRKRKQRIFLPSSSV